LFPSKIHAHLEALHFLSQARKQTTVPSALLLDISHAWTLISAPLESQTSQNDGRIQTTDELGTLNALAHLSPRYIGASPKYFRSDVKHIAADPAAFFILFLPFDRVWRHIILRKKLCAPLICGERMNADRLNVSVDTMPSGLRRGCVCRRMHHPIR